MPSVWNSQVDARSTGGFSGTVGQWLAHLGREHGIPDPYATWIASGGAPDCTDRGYGAHPKDFLDCYSAVAAVSPTDMSITDKLEARTLGIPNYAIGAAGTFGLGALLVAKGVIKRRPRRKKR